MSLIVEDGSIIPDANSYETLQGIKDFAGLRGLTLPTTDAEIEVLAIRAFDYLESLKYKGEPAVDGQPSQWPRDGVFVRQLQLLTNEIPVDLKKAQSQLTVEANTTVLFPTGDGREVIKEKVDVIERQFAKKGTSVNNPVFTSIEGFLCELLKSGANSLLSSVRV